MAGPKETDEGSGVAVEEAKPILKEPRRYAVMLHNDDYTTMEFVVEVLNKFFSKTQEEAIQIMLRIHNEGKGVAGIYSLEIAEMKVEQVTSHARANGFPLKVTAEPIEL